MFDPVVAAVTDKGCLRAAFSSADSYREFLKNVDSGDKKEAKH